MRKVVFDVVELCAQRAFGNAEHTREFFAQVSYFRRVCQTIFRLAQHTEALSGVQDLFVQVG